MSKEEMIQHFRNSGNTCFMRKNYAEAITNYKKGLELDETNPNLNNNIAQAYLETHDYRNAEEYAKRAIKTSQHSPKGYFRAARASAGLGYKDKALEYLKNGIDNCEDKKYLSDYYQALQEDGAAFVSVDDVSDDPPPLVSDSDTDDSIDDNKLRSRSTSRMTTDFTYVGSQRESVSHRSVSMSRTSSMSSTSSKTNKKGKKKKSPIEMEDIFFKDPFLSTLESIKKEKGIQNLTPEQFWVMKRKDFNMLLKEGSEVMASGLSRKAVEKYKAALDMILDHSIEDFRIKEIEFLALKYALCVAWIELANYADIAKAIEYLIEIEGTRASKFPAVFYGLGSAYYKLNRFKASTEHLEKGLLFLNRQVKFEVLSWPGTNNIIPETTRAGLEELLKELLKTCRAYHEPDAVCRYSKCLALSSHIIPSDHIFYSDPDFCGFVVVFCEEKCKIEYHMGCWKEYKEVSSSDKVGKLSDKDFIGRECPTTDCLNQFNNRSAIVKIEIVGDDTTIKTCIEAPKIDLLVKESKKSKKKKTEKSSDATNHEKPKSKNRQKVKKTSAETLQPNPQQEVQTTNSAEELESRISKLDLLREVKFGYTDDEIMDPREIFYGRIDMQIMDDFSSPEFDNDSAEIKAKKEFVFSFFYEYIKNEGPQKLKEIEQKWQSEVIEYEDVKDFMKTQSSICNFLLQSYRFAAIDDYICLSEQLPDTYNRAKTELRESLSFTLTGQAKCSNQLNENLDMEIENKSIIPKNNIDISSPEKETVKLSDGIADPCKDGDSEEVEKISENNQDMKKDDSNDSISENFDYVEVEDPGIDTSDCNIMKERTRLLSVGESIVSGGDDGKDIDNINSDAQEIDSEDKNVEEEEGEEVVMSELNPNAGELQGEDKDVEKQKIEDTIETSGFLEDKKVQSRDSTLRKTDLESGPPTLLDLTVRPTHQQWSLEDSFPRETSRFIPSPYLQQYPNRLPAALPVRQIPHNNTCTQTEFNIQEFNKRQTMGEIDKIKKELNIVQKKFDDVVKNHDQERIMFEEEKKKRAQRNNAYTQTDFNVDELIKRKTTEEIDKIKKELNIVQKKFDDAEKNHDNERIVFEEEKKKRAQEAKLENAKIRKEMEKEKNVLKEKVTKLEKETIIMKEKMAKLCDKFKNENTRLEKENLELEKSYNASKEQLRDLISKTGQQVKELENERDQYQELVLELKIETAKLKSGIYKQKCHDIRQAMIRKEGLSELESSEMTQVILALQKCETALITYEEKVKAKCDSVATKIGSISSGEFFNIEWPHLPIGPGCPLKTMEELTRKVTEEKRNLEKSVAEDDQPRPLFPPFAPPYPAAVPSTPVLQPTYYPGTFARDKSPVRVQEMPTPSPATESKPAVVPVTDRNTEQPNASKLTKDMQDLTLPLSTNRAVPEKKSVSSVFEIRSPSPPFRFVGSKPASVFSASSIAAARPKLVAVPTPSISATTVKKPGGSSYQKLMAQLLKNFPTKTEEELEACVAEVREKNNNSLSGLTLPSIISKVDEVLKEKAIKKQGSMGLDKFGGTAWGGLRVSTNSWSKPKDNYDGDCPICMEPMEKDLTSLQCKHCFHTECIKKWLRTNSICPNCRVFTKLEEEFPPLS